MLGVRASLGDGLVSTTFLSEFQQHFGAVAPRDLLQTRAPGRVNLIGEHTDYNDGFVLPIAIERHSTIVARPRLDASVRLYSLAREELAEFSLEQQVAKGAPGWSLYARGVAEALRAAGLVRHGVDALVASDIPLGGGLSSSASFEVAFALALLAANGQTLPPVQLAQACRWAENEYAGAPCGIMDQFISVLAEAGRAMLLDCRDLSYRQVPLRDPDIGIMVINSQVHHNLAQGQYALRRAQCRQAVDSLRADFPQITSLREVSGKMLAQGCSGELGRDKVVLRRAGHVVGENQRTLDFAAALERQDWHSCGELMYQSHQSLRDDYEVSCPELDVLVEIARSVPGVYGARMTGGGFGGCIVALTRREAGPRLAAAVQIEYPRRCGHKALLFLTEAAAGASVQRPSG